MPSEPPFSQNERRIPLGLALFDVLQRLPIQERTIQGGPAQGNRTVAPAGDNKNSRPADNHTFDRTFTAFVQAATTWGCHRVITGNSVPVLRQYECGRPALDTAFLLCF